LKVNHLGDLVTVATLCAQFTRDLLATAKVLKIILYINENLYTSFSIAYKSFKYCKDTSMNKAVSFVSQDTFVPQTSSSTVNAGPQKKKRTKVTDTRLSPRVARALLQDGFYHRSRPLIDLINRKRRPQFPLSAADLSVLLDYCANYYAAPALSEWGIKHCFCPSVRPSVAYIANNSRTRRPSMPKFGIKAPHL